jgi:hypothetical protein
VRQDALAPRRKMEPATALRGARVACLAGLPLERGVRPRLESVDAGESVCFDHSARCGAPLAPGTGEAGYSRDWKIQGSTRYGNGQVPTAPRKAR